MTGFIPGKGKNILLVAVGGAAGALARSGLDAAIPAPASGFPLGILLVNLAGCLLLGWLLGGGAAAVKLPAEATLLLGTGLMGSFTTMSTFSVQLLRLLESGQHLSALAYIACSLIGGLLLSWGGLWLGRKSTPLREGDRR